MDIIGSPAICRDNIASLMIENTLKRGITRVDLEKKCGNNTGRRENIAKTLYGQPFKKQWERCLVKSVLKSLDWL